MQSHADRDAGVRTGTQRFTYEFRKYKDTSEATSEGKINVRDERESATEGLLVKLR